MPIMEITPLDTLFFRDGKPFNAAEEDSTGSAFPPNPSVLYGFLRTLYLSDNPDCLSQLNTENDKTKDLIIKGIYYKIDDNIFFPAPLDLVNFKKSVGKVKDENGKKIYSLEPLSFSKSVKLNNVSPNYLFPNIDKQVDDFSNSIVETDNFKDYLYDDDFEGTGCRTINDYLVTESKTGIKKGVSGNSEKGHLYRINSVRTVEKTEKMDKKNIKIVIHYEGLNFSQLSGIGKLGGESRTCQFKILKENNISFNSDNTFNSDYFKIILLTPAYFEDGWLPKAIKSNPNIELISVVLGKPLNIGGFDMESKTPKPMFKAVPAGSCYVLKIKNSSNNLANDLKKIFHFSSISEDISYVNPKNNTTKVWKTANEGYGISVIGKVKIDGE